ncbi:hypothetical protein KAR91_48595 [Candidatus Pacearchaeota archaeon]|nr:hypothetical protein [Candidatus Pacearchaeota archaeon]
MKIIKFKDANVTIDEDCTATVILSTKPPVAVKISLAEQIAMLSKTMEVLTEQNKIPSDVIKVIRDNIEGG